MSNKYINKQEDNISVYYSIEDETFIKETLTGLKQSYLKLFKYFKLKNEQGFSVNAYLATNRKEYENLVINLLKVDIKVPTRKSVIAQPQGSNLILLTPLAYEVDSIYEYSIEDYQRLLYHEITHMFQEYISPDMENLPRWFTEGMAIYLSMQWKYEDEFKGPVLKSITERNVPTFKEINENIVLSYIWGWTLIKYIVDIYGNEEVIKILTNWSNESIFDYIDVNHNIFENNWRDWVLKRVNMKV